MIDLEKENPENIDYVGLNISSNSSQLKIYYKSKKSCEESHPVLERICQLDMMRYVTAVRDGENDVRFDFGLKNRTNDNINDLCIYISELSPLYKRNRDEIEYFSRMNIDRRPSYDLAALYFFGFLEKLGAIEGIKFHFITRHCKDSDILHKNVQFDDTYFGSYIQKSNVTELSDIMMLTNQILSELGGHIWMVGVDCFRDGRKKYKVYIKEPDLKNIDKLTEIVSENQIFCDVKKNIKEYIKFVETYPEYIPEGIAIGIHSGMPTLNFYFRYKNDHSHKVTEE